MAYGDFIAVNVCFGRLLLVKGYSGEGRGYDGASDVNPTAPRRCRLPARAISSRGGYRRRQIPALRAILGTLSVTASKAMSRRILLPSVPTPWTSNHGVPLC